MCPFHQSIKSRINYIIFTEQSIQKSQNICTDNGSPWRSVRNLDWSLCWHADVPYIYSMQKLTVIYLQLADFLNQSRFSVPENSWCRLFLLSKWTPKLVQWYTAGNLIIHIRTITVYHEVLQAKTTYSNNLH
jgi:hypothetical protein